MKYVFNEDYNSSLTERILEVNNVDLKSLDVSNFEIDYQLDVLNRFKDKLLSYKDSRFLIVGDYDCDGICATAIIKNLFDSIGIACNYYIPSRTKEGYGLNSRIVDAAKENGFDCIFCVDNGIVANKELKYAKELGLKVFIVDHHEYQIKPDCESYLHPNIFPSNYSDMCAGGLCALISNSFEFNELATALGGLATLADMVYVFNYNRFLAKQMLDIVKKGKIASINLLLGKADATYKNISFNVVPKINAVSRLDDLMNVNYVVKFLLSNETEALAYYDKIEHINKARKEYSQQMFLLACRLVDSSKNIIVIKHPDFKEGLCGLVANRLLEEYGKPTIVFAESNGLLKGSGRSMSGANMYEYLKGAGDIFEAFGGHELAIGASISADNYDKLIEYINTNEIEYKEKYTNVITIEPDKVSFDTLDEIRELEPFGTGFVEPLLAFKKPKYTSRYVVAYKYPKFDINDRLSAISFNSKFINTEFEYMIGHLNKDNYYEGKLSFLIEDLV